MWLSCILLQKEKIMDMHDAIKERDSKTISESLYLGWRWFCCPWIWTRVTGCRYAFITDTLLDWAAGAAMTVLLKTAVNTRIAVMAAAVYLVLVYSGRMRTDNG